MSESTVLGAAFAAGRAVGVWKNFTSLPTSSFKSYLPSIDHDGTGMGYSSFHVSLSPSQSEMAATPDGRKL